MNSASQAGSAVVLRVVTVWDHVNAVDPDFASTARSSENEERKDNSCEEGPKQTIHHGRVPRWLCRIGSARSLHRVCSGIRNVVIGKLTNKYEGMDEMGHLAAH